MTNRKQIRTRMTNEEDMELSKDELRIHKQSTFEINWAFFEDFNVWKAHGFCLGYMRRLIKKMHDAQAEREHKVVQCWARLVFLPFDLHWQQCTSLILNTVGILIYNHIIIMFV